MTLYEKYQIWLLGHKNDKLFLKADLAVFKIINNLAGRCGLGVAWEKCDDDIKNEIMLKWRAIIES